MKYQNLKRIIQCLITAHMVTYTIGCASSRLNQKDIKFFNEIKREYERVIEKKSGPDHPHDFRHILYSDINEYKSINEIVDEYFKNIRIGLFDFAFDTLPSNSISPNLNGQKTSNNHEEATIWTTYKGTITDIFTEENKGPIPDKQEYPFVNKITIKTDNGTTLRIKNYSSNQEGVNYTRDYRFPIGRNLELEVLEDKDAEGFYKTWKLD